MLGLSFLYSQTQPGLFMVSRGGPRLWVFESLHGRIALQLDASPKRPKFSYCQLGPEPIALGLWLGPVRLALGEWLPNGACGEAGFICSYRDRLLVKANSSDGTGKQLPLVEFGKDDYSPRTIFCRSWKLLSAHGEHLSLFDAPPEIEFMMPYSDNARWDPSGTQFK